MSVIAAMVAPAMVLQAAEAHASPQAAIMRAMEASAAAWNRGDLRGFVGLYTPDAIYTAGAKIARGRDANAASFTAGGNRRGRLSFQPVAWRPLSAVHVLHVARWTLTPATAGAKPETGLTTLLFERRREGWRIIADHSG